MTDGMWTLHDDGSFELAKPYRELLEGAKMEAARAWAEALVAYLEPRCPYSGQELTDELVRRNEEREDGAMATVDEFVLEALSGDL